jgi:uncharacterized protein (DUF983 family)
MNDSAPVACPTCGAASSKTLPKTFLGFRKLHCVNCGADSTLPLSSGYRLTYLVVFAAMIVVGISIYRQGQVPLPGFIAIAIVIALIRDFALRKRVR